MLLILQFISSYQEHIWGMLEHYSHGIFILQTAYFAEIILRK